MTQFLYNLLLTLLAPVAVPVWAVRSLVKGHSWASLSEALGRIAALQGITALENTTQNPPIWFHAVSVGEIQSSIPLLRRLRDRMPSVPIYVSTGTPTGRRLAEERLAGLASGVFRAPLDLPWCVSGVLSVLRPRLLVVSETEIWPNLFFQASRHGVPAMIVNGRISDRSYPRYRSLRFAFRAVLKCVNSILAQSETDRRRFVDAGARAATTKVGGNLKYDVGSEATIPELSADLREYIEAAAPGFVLVAGSTREGEEAALVPALRQVAAQAERTLIVVAPRHPQRFDEAATALRDLQLPLVRRTELAKSSPTDLPAVLLLDSLGELGSLYRRADLVFVGGSLNGWGGHNVLEPVLFRKPVVVGPYMQNFREIAAGLLAAGGLVQVVDAVELGSKLPALALDAGRRAAIGRTGEAFTRSQRGATDRATEEAVRLYRRAMPRIPPSAIRYAALRMPAALWSVAARARRWGYTTGLIRSGRLSVPVVSVGNLTAGGTGKTPTVAWLVERLWEQGYTAGVLTRGYGRSDPRRLIVVEPGSGAAPADVGDEPAILARRFGRTAPKALLAVHRDRRAGGRLLASRAGIDVLVMDDGFQHMQLHRTLNVVLLDTTAPIGNGYTLPLGMLRESVGCLAAADVVLLTRCESDRDDEPIRELIREHNQGAEIIRSKMVATGVLDLGSGRSAPLQSLAGARVAAFCGIGNPDSFWREVRSHGCEVVFQRSFRDHHRYSAADKIALARAATEHHADLLLTTEKDGMNLGGLAELRVPVWALGVELQVENPEPLLAHLLRAANP